LILNGDFEAPSESGWRYEGHRDGSHGVFSEPSRPGTRVYLLQLLTPGPSSFSALSQKVAVRPGRNYRVSLEFFDSCERIDGSPVDSLTATVDGETVFSHALAARNGSGWQQRAATFQAKATEVEIVIRLQGETLSREDSTVAIDNVELIEAPNVVIKPFRPGYPFVRVTRRVSLPVGLAFAPPTEQVAGYEPLEQLRQHTGQTPAYLAWNATWDPAGAPHERFAAIRPHLEAWVRSGVVPILTIRGAAPLNVPEDLVEPFLRSWAREIGDWGYPLLLRPWPDMEKLHPSGSAREFTEFWRKGRTWFAAEGAGNVLWFWTPETLSKETDPFYPGDAHVDLVGAPEGPASLEATYEHFQLHYRRKALAIPETTQPGTLANLDEVTTRLVEHFPRIEFYTHSIDRAQLWASSPPAFASNPAWQGKSPLVQFSVLQQSPPRAMATLSRLGNSNTVRAVVTNISEDGAPAASDFTADFYSGHPDEGGVRVGSPHFLRLGRGREKTIQQSFRPGDAGVPHLKIAGKPGPGMTKATAQPTAETRVFRLVP
jgi:hypothetical protein